MKLVLNTWLAFEVEAAAEAASLTARLGMPADTLADVAGDTPLGSPLALAKLAKIQLADDRPDFSLEWALKDLELMRSSAGSAAAPVAGAIAERWQSLVERGLGSLDVSAARHGLGEEPPVELGAIQSLSAPPE